MHPVETTGLSRRYGRRVGVDGIDLSIGEGEIFGFLGPNGAGKTTTIRVLLGFLRPTSGAARIFGRDCWSQSPVVKRDVGYLPGDVRLYSWWTLHAALSILGQVRGIDLRSAGRALAERLQLEPDLPVRKMSRGTRQKLGLVLALAHRPRLILLDEPTSGLDPIVQAELMRLLREAADEGRTVFFSSHTLSEVDALCHRVAIVRAGRIVADESLDSLRDRAPRRVELTFSSEAAAAAAEPPEEFAVKAREGRVVCGSLVGTAAGLVRWAAPQPIDDVSIGRPDLEDLFQAYYAAPKD